MSDTFIGALVEKHKRDNRVLLGPWRIRPLHWGFSADVEWKPQDLWIGAFWKRTRFDGFSGYSLWLCVLPCIPLHIWWYRKDADHDQ